jgi:uncharacterized protein involved in outer membrane biogenesis
MPARARRRLVVAITGIAVLVLVVGVILALPVVVRRVAVDRLTTLTGRAVALGSVELNLFTGRVALNGFRLAQRDPAQPAIEIERLEVRVALTTLVREHVRVTDLTVPRPKMYVTRLANDKYDFSDLLALVPPPDPSKKPPAPDEQLARLRTDESLPGGRLADLLARRATIVRDDLVRAEGVPEARLLAAEAAGPAAADGEGRVEFRIDQ